MKNLIITLFIFSLCSCGKSVIGDYSTTIPFAGKGKDGYPIISLNSDNTVEWIIRNYGDYTVGKWEEENGKVLISGMIHHDIDGAYSWNNHPHGDGPGDEGLVLSEKNSYPMGRVLFQLD
jgi:hypothetical protein|tara:strand:- start:250 stop:609 length:360 start_codon:yes stop_codon:yes gene_type:complete